MTALRKCIIHPCWEKILLGRLHHDQEKGEHLQPVSVVYCSRFLIWLGYEVLNGFIIVVRISLVDAWEVLYRITHPLMPIKCILLYKLPRGVVPNKVDSGEASIPVAATFNGQTAHCCLFSRTAACWYSCCCYFLKCLIVHTWQVCSNLNKPQPIACQGTAVRRR